MVFGHRSERRRGDRGFAATWIPRNPDGRRHLWAPPLPTARATLPRQFVLRDTAGVRGPDPSRTATGTAIWTRCPYQEASGAGLDLVAQEPDALPRSEIVDTERRGRGARHAAWAWGRIRRPIGARGPASHLLTLKRPSGIGAQPSRPGAPSVSRNGSSVCS